VGDWSERDEGERESMCVLRVGFADLLNGHSFVLSAQAVREFQKHGVREAAVKS
jgi:hypothetical protein